MIYLILDTNIWLYLANGTDPITDKPHDELHFELLSELKEKQQKKEICIITSEIVIQEWKRNKENANLKIRKLKNKLSNTEGTFNDANKYIKSGTEQLFKEYNEGIQAEIQKNLEHIDQVENFLMNECTRVELSSQIKIRVFDISLQNKAPFHNKKNNIADITILLSASEYLKKKHFNEEYSAIFVSNNISDFTDGKNKDDFHPDIKSEMNNCNIKYERILPSALKISNEIIAQIEALRKHELWMDSISFYCKSPFCDNYDHFSPWGYLDELITFKSSTEEFINPNQILLFDNLPKLENKDKEVGIGKCVICDSIHIECPNCGELTLVEEIDDCFNCSECKIGIEYKYDNQLDKNILIVHNKMNED